LSGRSRIDYALAAHAMPGRLEGIAELEDAGIAFIKAFTCTTHGLIGFTPAELRELFEVVAANRTVCLVHCEDESLTAAAEARLRSAQRDDGGVISEWRNREAELVAVGYTTLLARTTGARVVIAHVSHPAVLALVAAERDRGADVLAESCPQYLQLFEDEALTHGAFRKFTPPARARSAADLDAMWAALRDGEIALLSSDHAPSTREQKTGGSIWDVHFGLPGIDTTFPVLLTAAAQGRVSYERIVDAYATTPAITYGLGHRKGRVEPGMDADLVLVDPDRRWTLDAGQIASRAGWSPYEGVEMHGAIVSTYCRGQAVARDGAILAEPGYGEFIPAIHHDKAGVTR
jgi:dihydroorotase-like cyclic amidohydrolase